MFKSKSKLIIVVMLIFGITAFMSCEKRETNTELPPNDISYYTLYDSVGYWHNVAVSNVYKSVARSGEINYKSIHNQIIDALYAIDSSTFNLIAMQANIILMDNKYNSDLNIVIDDSVLILNSQSYISMFNDLSNENEISNQLEDSLISITNLVNNGVPMDVFLNEVHSLQTISWSATDQLFVNILIQTVDASYQFWIIEGNYSGRACDTCIIWADAAGALYGMIVPGGITSIIVGAVFSTIAAIQQ